MVVVGFQEGRDRRWTLIGADLRGSHTRVVEWPPKEFPSTKRGKTRRRTFLNQTGRSRTDRLWRLGEINSEKSTCEAVDSRILFNL